MRIKYLILFISALVLYIISTDKEYFTLNIFPKTKAIEHPVYNKIKCFEDDNVVCKNILSGLVWEESLMNNVIKKYIKNDTTVLDCGAFVGSHTILISQLDRNNDIFCFEMMPEHYKLLQDNIKLNDLPNVTTFNVALSDKLEKINIPKVNYTDVDKNLGFIGLYLERSKQLIPSITLDSIMIYINKPVSFIKLDIEGNEIPALYGAKHLITTFRPVILIELWKATYDKLIKEDIYFYLLQIGYNLTHLSGDDFLLKPE